MKSQIDAPVVPNPEKSQLVPPGRAFRVQLSSTRRGARLARLLARQQLAEWGVPYDSELSHAAGLITTELAGNAVRHCGGIGRDFRIRLALEPARILRIEVTDARADRPLPTAVCSPGVEASDAAESGHGLTLVDALATRWGSTVNDLITKTVWAEIETSPNGHCGTAN